MQQMSAVIEIPETLAKTLHEMQEVRLHFSHIRTEIVTTGVPIKHSNGRTRTMPTTVGYSVCVLTARPTPSKPETPPDTPDEVEEPGE